MSSKKKKILIESKLTQYDIYKTIRNTWGSMIPTTKVMEDKTNYDRQREKGVIKKDLKEL